MTPDGDGPTTVPLPAIDGLPYGHDAHLVPAPGAVVIGAPGSRDRQVRSWGSRRDESERCPGSATVPSVTRHAARSASAAALVVLAFVAGCSSAPAGSATAPPSSSPRTAPPSVPPEQAGMWTEAVDRPKRTVSADDLCGLLTAAEITRALGATVLEGVATTPTKCAWQLDGATDRQGRPVAGVVLHTPKTPLWLGDPAVVAGHPARHKGGNEVCVLRVLLREPVEKAGDLPVLELTAAVPGVAEDRCPAAESLAGFALDRLPAA